MQKKYYCYIIFSLVSLLFSCESTKYSIEKSFKPIYKTANIAMKFMYTIRNQSNTIPEYFYIQNLKTFEYFKLEYDSENILFAKNIPLGEYRIGFWTGIYDSDNFMFRMFGYSYYIFKIDKSGNYNLGTLIYKCNVDSLIVFPTAENFESVSINKKQYIDYSPLYVKKSSIDMKMRPEYKEFGYGFAKDVQYIAINSGTVIREKNKYSLQNVNSETERSAVIDSMIYSIELEKYSIEKALKEIYSIYLKNGIDEALTLIDQYKKKSDDNINLSIMVSYLYYMENNIDYARYIIDEVYKRDPNCGEYFSLLAISEKDENIDKIKEYLHKAISLKTTWTISYNQYAEILLKDNYVDSAKMLNNYALEKDGNNKNFLETALKIANLQKNKKEIQKIEKKLKELK